MGDPSTTGRDGTTRRGVLAATGLGVAAWVAAAEGKGPGKKIQGFEDTDAGTLRKQGWQPVSDRKIRVGIVGYGVCRFGAAFGFQNHPNVDVVAVSDLLPDRRAVSLRKTSSGQEAMALRARPGCLAGMIGVPSGRSVMW